MRYYKNLFFLLLVVICFLTIIHPVQAQMTGAVPQVQAVYGGTVGVIASVPVSGETNKSRLFVATDSANSVFYADIDHSLADPYAATNYALRVVPDMDGNANHGTPSWLDVHPASMRMFAACDDGLFSCTIVSNSTATNIAGQMTFVLVESNTLFAVSSGSLAEDPRTLYYGALDASGTLTMGESLSATFRGNVMAAVNPMNRKLYVVQAFNQTNIAIYKSTSDYDAFSAATAFSSVSIPTNLDWIVESVNIGFGPDGRMFLGSGSHCEGTNNVRLGFSTNDGVSWTIADIGASAAGDSILNISCNGSTNAYEVYYGSCASSNKGESGTWAHMPRGGRRIPPFSQVDAGWMKVDPVNSQVIYFTTDKGLGASTNLGVDCFELNQGLTAVQINGMDFSASKDIAWLASQAGIRRATNFQTSPVWTDGELPNPGVNCVAMEPSDASGLTAYAASSARIYKTTTGGGTNANAWTVILNLDGDPGFGNGCCQAIRVDGSNIYAGFFGSTVQRGIGRFYMSSDSGTNWTAVATNIDVNDIVIRPEGDAQAVYIAVGKSYSGGSSDGGIYRYVPGSEMTRVLTNSVDIHDLAIDTAGGIYAGGVERNNTAGTDPNLFHLVVFYMASTSSTWSALATTGLTNNLSQEYKPVVTVGKDSSSNDVPILAAVRTLYYLPQGGTRWVNLYTYPNGSQIKMLYWDELMVGTTIGLYGQGINAQPTPRADPAMVVLGNWYLWLSAMGYQMSGPFNFGVSAEPVAADFDADGKADPTMVSASGGLWYIWFSGTGYQLSGGPWNFGVAGDPVAADFDGDRKADPAMVVNTLWYIWFSGAGYQLCGGPWNFGVEGYPVAADFDGDGKGDPCMVVDSLWYIWFSGAGYQLCGGPWNFGVDGIPVAADFDADGKADPAMVVNTLWYIWFSGAGYQLCGGPWNFGVDGFPVPADFDGR